MNCEQKYKEALERANEAVKRGMVSQNFVDDIFGVESEDERIREAIESIIRVYGKTQGEWIAGYDMDTLVVHLRNAFASLEKQKEQKPAEWSEEDEKEFENLTSLLDIIQGSSNLKPGVANHYRSWLKSLRPQPQGIYQQTVDSIRNMIADYESRQPLTADRMQDLIDNIRVKCKDAVECAEILNDETHWKPSEEQMRALEYFLKLWGKTDEQIEYTKIYNNVKCLYDDLKKLLK